MYLVFSLTLLLLATLATCNETEMYREGRDAEAEEKTEESFDSPVYGPAGKSAFNAPAPAPALPASYAAYIAGLGYGGYGGYGLPYSYGPYSRYGGAYPYTSPAGYGYGSLLNNPGFASPFLSGLGYAGYGNSYLGRSLYPGYGYGGYPGFLSGLGYPPAPLRRGPVPVAPASAPVGVGSTVPRAALAALPAPFAAYPPPASAVPAPVSPFSNTIPGGPAPLPAAFPYRAPYRAVKGKDGAIRYIPVDIQNLYK